MARRNIFDDGNRRREGEGLFVSANERSLNKGRRAAPRTEVLRPCVLWRTDDPGQRYEGVLLDLNPHGMRIRMFDLIPSGTEVTVVMMRDDEFSVPLSREIPAKVVRQTEVAGGFIDYGIQLRREPIPRSRAGATIYRPAALPRRYARSRMHTLDIVVGDRGTRRTGR